MMCRWFLVVLLSSLCISQVALGQDWPLSTMWSHYRSFESQLAKDSYHYYGEILSGSGGPTTTWRAGGESAWRYFLNHSLIAIDPYRASDLVIIRKGFNFENVTHCSNRTIVTKFLINFESATNVTSQLECNGVFWKYKRCKIGCVGVCIGCKNPCYSRCDKSAVISPYNDWSCLPRNYNSTVIQFLGIQEKVLEEESSGKRSKNIVELVILIVLSMLLVVVVGLSCVCFFIIQSRRRNLKRQRRLEKEAWKMENVMRRALTSMDSHDDYLAIAVSGDIELVPIDLEHEEEFLDNPETAEPLRNENDVVSSLNPVEDSISRKHEADPEDIELQLGTPIQPPTDHNQTHVHMSPADSCSLEVSVDSNAEELMLGGSMIEIQEFDADTQ